MNLNPGHLPTYKALFPVLRTQTGAILEYKRKPVNVDNF